MSDFSFMRSGLRPSGPVLSKAQREEFHTEKAGALDVLRALRALATGRTSESDEDQFHRRKAHVGKTLSVLLVARDEETFQNFHPDAYAAKVTGILRELRLEAFPFEDVLTGAHPALHIMRSEHPRTLEAWLDHSYVGGSKLLRLLEAGCRANARALPRANVLHGLWHAVRFARFFWRLGRVPEAASPTGSLRHLYKTYQVARADASVSRRFVAYHALLLDALVVSRKASIRVAFTAAFESSAHVVNNVGIIILEFDANTTVAQLQQRFHAAAPMALATNALMLTRIAQVFGSDPLRLRRRLDLVCTSMVVGPEALDASVFVRAGGRVYEQAYSSLMTRLHADGTARVAVCISTNDDDAPWEAAGFSLAHPSENAAHALAD